MSIERVLPMFPDKSVTYVRACLLAKVSSALRHSTATWHCAQSSPGALPSRGVARSPVVPRSDGPTSFGIACRAFASPDACPPPCVSAIRPACNRRIRGFLSAPGRAKAPPTHAGYWQGQQ
jgi:hypothetical protein